MCVEAALPAFRGLGFGDQSTGGLLIRMIDKLGLITNRLVGSMASALGAPRAKSGALTGCRS